MSVTLYGLNTCDTCKKARNWLARHSRARVRRLSRAADSGGER